MNLEQRLSHISPSVVHASTLSPTEKNWRELAGNHASRQGANPPSHIRLRRGWYTPAEAWAAAAPEERQLAAIVASTRSEWAPPVYSHRSAATLLGLPAWSHWMVSERPRGPNRAGVRRPGPGVPRELTVHITVPVGAHGTGSRYVVRHRNRLSPTECVRIAGVHLTGWERTLFDLARTEPFVVALACADAALRAEVRSGRGGRQIDATAWEAWRARLLDRAERLPRGRGIAAVRALAELADPRADSPLESVSRLRALQLGIEVEPQAEVLAEDGGSLFVDLLMREYGVFGECDGKSKYTDPALRGGQSAAEIVYAEKRRHDWIAGTQRWRGVRWGAAEVTTSAAFARFLTAHGVPVPGKPARRHSPSTARVLAHAG